MLVHGLTPILSVSNLAESFEWFEKLGWKKHWDWGTPPSFGAVINGKCEIFLCLNCQGAQSKKNLQSVHYDEMGGSWMTWWLESPAEVDKAYQQAIKNGITVGDPPMDMSWNVRECLIRHPDGHVFRLSSGLEEE